MFDKARDIFIAFNLDEAAKYFDSISIEEFESLINKPNFFSNIYEKLAILSCVSKDNLVKTKLLLKHIIDNDIYSILNDKYSLKGFMRCLISEQNKELLNCFLEIVPLEKVEIILDYLFSGNLNLDDILFNEYNKEIISRYIVKCCNNNDVDKLLKIFRVIYGNIDNQFNWIEFIIARLLVEDKLDLFLEYYKGLIDESDDFTTFKEKERLVSLLVFLVNVMLEKIDGDENLLNDFTNNLFDKLGLDNSKEITDTDFQKTLSSPSEKIVAYMNDLVGSWSKGVSYIASEIIKSPVLIKYILPKNVIMYELNKFCRIMSEVDFVSYDEIEKIFFNDEININLIKNFSSSILIECFHFECIDDLDDNDEMLSVFKSILKKYFSYEKAIFIFDKLKIDEVKKVDIINEVYQDRNINDIKTEKDKLINECKEELLSLSGEVSDLFKLLLPELIELPYDEELFKKLMYNSLEINKLEYLFVYLSLYFKKLCNDKNLNYNTNNLTFIPKYYSVRGSINGEHIVINYADYSKDCELSMWQNIDYIETINHEKTHLWQDTMSSVISMDALMIGLEENLIFDNEYYNSNYYNFYIEVHARIVSFYETYNHLKEINPYAACEYLERNRYLYNKFLKLLKQKKEERTKLEEFNVINSSETLVEEERSKLDELNEEIKEIEKKIANIITFNMDRKLAKSIEYFANLINTFLERTTKEKIIDLRKGFKTLELITDEDGRFYDVNEIEERMNSIKSYSTNDIEFNPIDRDTKLFYARYLHNLRYCLDNGLINFNYDTKEKR